MRHQASITKIFAILALGLIAGPLSAWGPMTHLAINARAYSQAALDSRHLLAVPAGMKNLFIGGGPAPDIKFNAGDEFPREFHFDPETILRMVELAKSDSRYGLSDVAMALGWAGHLFAEVPSAHAAEGYPGTKLTAPLPNAGYINHQLCELCIDILTYREMKELLRQQSLNLPVRLLAASMKAEHDRDSQVSMLTAEQLKTAGNAFLPTVVGVRTIADYLMAERPELLDEMDAFYADRRDNVDRSVNDVADMLREHGYLKTAKASIESADRADSVRVTLAGTLKDKTKAFVFDALYKSLRSGKANDIFTFVACHAIDGIMSNGLKNKFSQIAGNAVGGSIANDARHQQVVKRFVEGLLCRHDLTFPEIIAYATEGLEKDQAGVSKQRKQFSALGLADDGRKLVTNANFTAAIAEVQRIEDVRREWPWFWPFRPSIDTLAEARSKAARLMAFQIIDDSGSSSPMRDRAQALLRADKAVRTALWNSRSTGWLTPITKWKNRQALEQAEAALAPQERFFAQLVQIRQRAGEGEGSAEKLQALWNEADLKRREVKQSLAGARAALQKLPIYQVVARDKKKDEIKNLEAAERTADEYFAALELLQGMNASTSAGTASETTEAGSVNAANAAIAPQEPGASIQMPEKYAGKTALELRKLRENAYRTYTGLTQSRSTDDPEAIAALRELREIDQARRALEAAGSGN
ncbi:MAG TPA: hypothetical protein PKM25_01640 [Candidatus Ozemobacteraceae bacterium]|nr:hypothetical protein [Candidatus Ozemobacteraceae bacterium]